MQNIQTEYIWSDGGHAESLLFIAKSKKPACSPQVAISVKDFLLQTSYSINIVNSVCVCTVDSAYNEPG